MKCKPLHCWDCGIPVIEGVPGQFKELPILRQVKFNLTGGAYCESTFCVDCAEQPWTRDRINEFKDAVDQVNPAFRLYRITDVEGHAVLGSPIAAVFGAR